MRLSSLLALSLLALLVLSACGPGSPLPVVTQELSEATGTAASPIPLLTTPLSPAPSPTPLILPVSPPAPTPLPALGVDPVLLRGLNLQVWHAFAGPAHDLFTRQAAQFNAENAWGILVNPVGYGDYASLFDAVNTVLDSGGPPGLVAALPEHTLAWDASGTVADLNPYLGDPQWALPSDARADIPSIFLAQDNVDGKQLGIPAQRSARLIFYNQTWAQELGFDRPPASAQEFRQQACAANASFRVDADPQNDGYGGWIIDTHWQASYAWLLAFGGGVISGDTYAFRTDLNLAALQYIKDLFDGHCAWISIEPTPFDSFARRSALFISADLAGLPAEMESMSRLKNSDVWTVIPFPGKQESLLVAYGPSYSVIKSTPEKQLAAWLFARWLLSPESQAQWVEATGLFPLRNSVLELIQPYRQASPQWEAAVGVLSQARNVPQLASWRKVRYVLQDGMTVFFQTSQPVDQLPALLDEMDSTARELE
jgi:multiple sugar transport system substrate-binding protein